jgi:putative Mn2+ efflux pump MntP
MKKEGHWRIIVFAVIAVVGVSGIVQALPRASESVTDLAEDAAILALVIAVSVLLARKFGPRGKSAK